MAKLGLESHTGKQKKCYNGRCNAVTSDYWYTGWFMRNGALADLCKDCGKAYSEQRFCEAFHSDDAGWRTCNFCKKRIHCGCIAALTTFCLLDTGGIECRSCADQRALAEGAQQLPLKAGPSLLAARHQASAPASNGCQPSAAPYPHHLEEQSHTLEGATPEGQPIQLPVQPRERELELAQAQGQGQGQGRISPHSQEGLCGQVGAPGSPENRNGGAVGTARPSGIKHSVGGGDIYSKAKEMAAVAAVERAAAAAQAPLPPPPPPPLGPSSRAHVSRLLPRSRSRGSSRVLPRSGRGGLDDAIGAEAEVGTGVATSRLVKLAQAGAGGDGSRLTPLEKRLSACLLEASSNTGSPRRSARMSAEADAAAAGSPARSGRPPALASATPAFAGGAAIDPARVRHLFEKMLSQSDAGRVGRLVVPKAAAEAHLPNLHQPEGVPLNVVDMAGRAWHFQYRFWPNNNSRMYVLEGMTQCIQTLKLQAGDTLAFGRLDGGSQLVVDCKRAGVSSEHPASASASGIKEAKKESRAGRYAAATSGRSRTSTPRSNSHSEDPYYGHALASGRPAASRQLPSGEGGGGSSSSGAGEHSEPSSGGYGWQRLRGRPPGSLSLKAAVPDSNSALVVIDGYEMEEYEDPPDFDDTGATPSSFPNPSSAGENVGEQRGEGEEQEHQWAQCDDCGRWRRLPRDVTVPAHWTCSGNIWDPPRSSCRVPQEMSDEDIDRLLGYSGQPGGEAAGAGAGGAPAGSNNATATATTTTTTTRANANNSNNNNHSRLAALIDAASLPASSDSPEAEPHRQQHHQQQQQHAEAQHLCLCFVPQLPRSHGSHTQVPLPSSSSSAAAHEAGRCRTCGCPSCAASRRRANAEEKKKRAAGSLYMCAVDDRPPKKRVLSPFGQTDHAKHADASGGGRLVNSSAKRPSSPSASEGGEDGEKRGALPSGRVDGITPSANASASATSDFVWHHQHFLVKGEHLEGADAGQAAAGTFVHLVEAATIPVKEYMARNGLSTLLLQTGGYAKSPLGGPDGVASPTAAGAYYGSDKHGRGGRHEERNPHGESTDEDEENRHTLDISPEELAALMERRRTRNKQSSGLGTGRQNCRCCSSVIGSAAKSCKACGTQTAFGKRLEAAAKAAAIITAKHVVRFSV